MIAVSGSTCGYPDYLPILIANSTILALNQWRDSIRVGRMMSSCRPEGASGEAKISNRPENTALVADIEPGRSMGWCLTSTNGHILTIAKGTVTGHANVVGGQGRPLHADGVVETGETPLALIVKDTGARFSRLHVTL